jgi:hypothetical protein
VFTVAKRSSHLTFHSTRTRATTRAPVNSALGYIVEEQIEVEEPFWSEQKNIALVVFVFGAVVCLVGPGGPHVWLALGGVGALLVLWVPWFWVWAVPRRYFMEPAPIQYVYVFGWAALLYWLVNALWRIFSNS